MSDKLLNIGPKSAAWLRQVGIRTLEDLQRLGAVGAFLKVKKAGFRPSLNLLYALAGAERGCHWTALSAEDKNAMVLEVNAAEDAAKKAKNFVMPARDVTPARQEESHDAMPEPTLFDSPDGGDDAGASGGDAGGGADGGGAD
jgi:hypothetical protein